LLEAKNVTKRFGGLTAIKNLSFYVSEGEILGIIGPNGAGKTTLFNVLSGLQPPDSGKIIFQGEDISSLKPYEICKKGIARTFQLHRPFLQKTAVENVLVSIIFGRNENTDMRMATEEAKEILRLVGITQEKEKTKVGNMAILDRKLVEIARALGCKPKLLLLDEVMAGLNPFEVDQFLDLIKHIRESGITIIVVEHIIRAVMKISDRIIVIHYGEKIAEGTPKEVSENKEVIRVYLGE
jgi:branched-chain amino acid transport system ATP-binding protein